MGSSIFIDPGEGAAGVLGVPVGGTGLASFTIGDMMVASGATSLAPLSDAVAGQVLASGGIGVLPAYTASPSITALTLSAALTAATAVLSGKVTTYNGVVTAGLGVAAIVGYGRATAQSAANASIATYTVGGADGSFEVSANLNATAVTVLTTTLTCTYTDESNTARTMIFPVQQLGGSFIAAGAITATGAWETPVLHIRAKAATVITILTSAGTFTGVTYTAEGLIKQTA